MSFAELVTKLSHEFKRYEEDEFKQLVLDYLAPPRELVVKTVNLFRSTLIVGPMNFGKTSFIEAKLGEVIKHLFNQGVDDLEIAYVYAQEVPINDVLKAIRDIDLNKVKYMYVFADDAAAAGGQFGRSAMSKENVRVSQFYIMIRHRLRNNFNYRYYIHPIHSTQVYTLVDITFRRTSQLKLFKDYPDEPQDLKVLGKMLGSAALQALREISFAISTAKNLDTFLSGIYRAVAYFKGIKRLVKAYHGSRNIEAEVNNLKRNLLRVQHVIISNESPPEAESRRPPITQEEFIRIVRELGIHASDRKLRSLYKLIFKDLLGYEVIEKPRMKVVVGSL